MPTVTQYDPATGKNYTFDIDYGKVTNRTTGVSKRGERYGLLQDDENIARNYAVYGLPGENEFYQSQIASGARTLGRQAQGQRSALFDNLESRGIGRSSIVGDQLVSLAASKNDALANVISDVRSQQFAARQQRINAYLNYLYQKKLQKKDQSWLGNLFQAAKAGANLLANRNTNQNDTSSTTITPYVQQGFDPGDYVPPSPYGPNP